MSIAFKRPITSILLLPLVCSIPGFVLLVGLVELTRIGLIDRVLPLWQREAAMLIIVFVPVLALLFLVHLCRFTSYHLYKDKLLYIGFLGNQEFMWTNIVSVERATRQEQYSSATGRWHGLALARLTMKNGDQVDLSVGGIENSDGLFEALNLLIAASDKDRDEYVKKHGKKHTFFASKLVSKIVGLGFFVALVLTIGLYMDATKSGRVGTLRKASIALENLELDRANELIDLSLATQKLDRLGQFTAEMLKARLLLAQGKLEKAYKLIEYANKEFSDIRTKRVYPSGLGTELFYLIEATKCIERGDYEKAKKNLSRTYIRTSSGYRELYTAKLYLREGNKGSALSTLSHLSTNEPGYFDYSYIAPETRVAAQKLLLAVKSGKTPIKVIPGLTKEQLLMKRSDYVIAILRIMQETVKSKEKAASLFTNTRTLIVNGGTKLKYAYSPSERIYGIAIKGKGNKYRQTVSQLVKENVGSRTSELFEKLVDEQTSITFEQLVGKGSYCLYLDSTSESIRSKLKTIDTESLLDGIDSDETIKSINIRVSNDVPIVDLSLSTRRSSKAIPELEQSNIENTSAVIEIPSLWISFHTYAFTITKWCEKHGLPSSIRKKLQTIAASTFSEAKWQAGAMKDTVLFYDQKDVEDIDFSKKLPN